jgi:hypothetical protein
MKEPYCEKEPEVVAALCGRSHDAGILDHAHSCPVCSEVLLVSEFLRKSTQLATYELSTLPDAALIWRKAQVLAREEALTRATLPIRIARISALVVAVLAAPWLILEFHQLWPAIVHKSDSALGLERNCAHARNRRYHYLHRSEFLVHAAGREV